MSKRIFCGFDSLRVDRGGIAREARLIAKVLMDPASGLDVPANGMTLLDTDPPADLSLPVRAAGASYRRFLTGVTAASWNHSHFIYGFIGLARAHGMLPFPRRPYLCFINGAEVWPGPWGAEKRVKAARRASMLVSISDFTIRRALEVDATFGRAKVCWLGTQEDTLPEPFDKTDNGPPRVLIVGRLEEGLKGHQQLIACWPTVLAAVPDAVLTIAGHGPRMAEFKQLAVASGVGDKIEFLGFVPDAAMRELWHRTAVFAMPGRVEGLGLTYIEAMRHGVPVIASIHDAGAEVNLHGQTGYNVDLDRPEELPDRIIQLLRDRGHAAALGANGVRRWSDSFSYSAFRGRFVPLLREFLSN